MLNTLLFDSMFRILVLISLVMLCGCCSRVSTPAVNTVIVHF
jgi:hypothetical protein